MSISPFDSPTSNMFPSSNQLLFGWLSNYIGRSLFFLGGVGSVINFTYAAVLYSAVRGQSLRERAPRAT